MDEKESKLVSLQRELNEALALAKEKEGAAIHWKLQYENKGRELKDEKENYLMNIKGNVAFLITLICYSSRVE